jgi:hypothetical protein
LVTGPISEQSRCNLGHGSNGNGSDGQKNRGGHCVAREARNLGTISCNLAHSPKGNLGGILGGNLGELRLDALNDLSDNLVTARPHLHDVGLIENAVLRQFTQSRSCGFARSVDDKCHTSFNLAVNWFD